MAETTWEPLAVAAMLAVALGLFGYAVWSRVAPLWALRRDDRCDRRDERGASLLRFGFLQRRLVAPEERLAGVLHVLVFAAFLVLAWRPGTLFGLAFGAASPRLWPRSTPARAYLFLKDLAVLAAIAGALGFLWRRLVTRPARVTRSWEGPFILGVILALMVTEALFDGSVRIVGEEPFVEAGEWVAQAFDPAAPTGSLGAMALHALVRSQGAAARVGAIALLLHLVL